MVDDVLLKHQDLINELKSDLGTAKFDNIFRKKTESLSKPDQFLIKMEMTRLSQPVARFIDLRGQVTGEVRSYEFNGKQHFMDNLAIEVFEKAIKQHGDYTLAVYEAVMNTENNHKILQKNAKKQALTKPNEPDRQVKKLECHMVKFASYETRIEERMNYAIKVQIQISPSDMMEASTSDISVSGCKVKLPVRYKLKREQKLKMRLVGLEQDFELGLKKGIEYEVVAIDSINNDINHIRMKRTFIECNASFDDFLRSFIHGNKRRYKVNLDNTLDAVIIKGYEQYYLPRVTSLSIFLAEQDDILTPTLVLSNENNIDIIRYFNDENKNFILTNILNKPRLSHLLAQQGHVKEGLFYCFTHISAGKIFYYSATDYELNQTPALKSLFLGFGSSKNSWRSFKVQLMPSHIDDAFIPLSLPETASEDVAKLNKPPSPRVQGVIQGAKYLVLLTDITTKQAQIEYKKNKYNKAQVNALKQYGHAKQAHYPDIDVVPLEYINLRSETRYLYKTEVQLEQEERGKVTGFTRDFSENGLQIELPQPMKYENGDLLLMTLPDLQKITKKHNLNNLPYEVMAVSKTKTIINLRSYRPTENSEHAGATFFTQLIDNNKSKLKASAESPKIPGLSTALRNMLTKSVCQFPFYIHKQGATHVVGAIGHGLYPSPLHLILSQYGLLDEYFDIESLFSNDILHELFIPKLKDMKRQDKPFQLELYLRFNPAAKDIKTALICDYIPLTATEINKQSFVKASIKRELFFGFRVYLSRTGRPDTEYLSKELSYITQYAIHKAKVLEEELWSVVGVGEILDITDELMQRFGIDPSILVEMDKRKTLWMQRLISNL
ncbi:PilZ domain-containing protein [Pseudoalteromonas denitrificans]|uniref:PilZ domain-containing protein n=1 Tax=Pseudoalteromonas denitrificans DSM 6059 TaxID=1123010 RepID=A0A1I1LZA6_9GAMM|nr:PilZ domain-containing protein [Pseudoalteromonas denitrificans]SFC75663.1 PilZ domain-containing protein [Pseudoalteromonas denitrificans DSM 6059]